MSVESLVISGHEECNYPVVESGVSCPSPEKDTPQVSHKDEENVQQFEHLLQVMKARAMSPEPVTRSRHEQHIQSNRVHGRHATRVR